MLCSFSSWLRGVLPRNGKGGGNRYQRGSYMNKIKKLLLSALCITLASAAVCGIAACSDANDKDPDNKPPVTGGEEDGGSESGEWGEISYQLTGHFTTDTLQSYGFDYYYVLNLFKDGTAAGSGYNVGGGVGAGDAEDKGVFEKWWKGTWEETENEEGLECIMLEVSYDSDAKNEMNGTLNTGDFEYQLYKNSEGIINTTVKIPAMSGRDGTLTGSSEVKYDDLDAFIAAAKEAAAADKPSGGEEEQPDAEGEALVTFTSTDGDTLTVYSDGTAQVSAFGGMVKPKFNWTYSGGVLKFVDAEEPEKSYTAVIDGKSATLEYKESFGTVNFSCEDISALMK